MHVLHVLDRLAEDGFHPDGVALLPPHSPFRKAQHIAEAIDTMLLFPVDSVVSVCQDVKSLYQHGAYGLTPLFEKKLLRLEKETLYEENGAIYLSRVEEITQGNVLGSKLGHITMTREDSIRIDSEFNFRLAEQMVKKGKKPGVENGY